jgi:membrane protein required for colicin V production
MEINYFDLVLAIIILFLGLKGVINGFFKELFGLIGIIGGIFLASRVGDSVGEYLSNMIFKFENHAAINFTGFLATLAIFWLFMVIIGAIFKKLSSMSGLGPVDKLLGFLFGASKFFLIAAVIVHAAYNIKAVKSTIDSNMQNNSILFPILDEVGGIIMKIDPVNMSQDLNITINDATKAVDKKVQSTIDTSTKEMIKEVKAKLKDDLPEVTEAIE